MQSVEPKIFPVAHTSLNQGGLRDYLAHIGAPGWDTTSCSDSELLIEVMGRSCYRSFKPGLNPNVKKVREGNDVYIKNIVEVRHGSVLEHASISFMFCDVSRVFTHELVRHRAGTAISQESLRYVRLTDLSFWAPTVIRENDAAMEYFEHVVGKLEESQKDLTDLLITDDMPFWQKKLITSAMRRVAPMGLATNIGWTCNLRSLRWIIQLRTDPSAEEEIRFVFDRVARIVVKMFPNLFADFDCETVDGHMRWFTPNDKV